MDKRIVGHRFYKRGFIMLQHGGRLNKAVKKYNIPLNNWIDCSTGINPELWPIPEIPSAAYNRLPEDDDDLHMVAKQYYQAQSLLAIPGSQSVIQLLPYLRSTGKVAAPQTGYAEHAYAWRQAGHCVDLVVNDVAHINKNLHHYDVLIIINPNNPTGEIFSPEQLLNWHCQLHKKNGWLIVDEAFIDTFSQQSIARFAHLPGLIVLRSLGKFFGLAGIRSGFVIAEEPLIQRINEKLGPWTIAGPSRFIASSALQDISWQQSNIQNLKQQSLKLTYLIEKKIKPLFPRSTLNGTDLFQTLFCDNAEELYEIMAKQGLLTRLLDNRKGVRFGLPKFSQWQQFEWVLNEVHEYYMALTIT